MSVTVQTYISTRKSVIRMAADELSIQIRHAIEQYSADVRKEIADGMKTVASNALTRVKAGSPKRTGRYSRGWKITETNEAGMIGFEIHQNSRQARLTHLLEDGHRTRNKRGWVKAQPHIRAVEQSAGQEAQKVIEKAVKG